MSEAVPTEADLLQRIRQLWRLNPSRQQHPAMCGCCAGGLSAIAPETFEEDVLDYLESNYAASGDKILHSIVQDRRTMPRTSILGWLRDLPAMCPDPEGRRRLMLDMLAILEPDASV